MITAEEFLKGGTNQTAPSGSGLLTADEFLKQNTKQEAKTVSTSGGFVLPEGLSPLTERPPVKKTSILERVKPFAESLPNAALAVTNPMMLLTKSAQKIEEKFINPLVAKVTEQPAVAGPLKTFSQATTGTGIQAMLKATSPDVTFSQAYKAMREEQEKKDKTVFNKFLTQLTDAAPQTLIGVALNFAPGGKGLSTAYWTGIASGSQIERKGKVTSPVEVGIEVLGDRMLGSSLEGLFKKPANSLLNTIKKSFAVEGGTEVAQDLLTFANDWRLAKSPEEKNQIISDAKQYIKSGQILMTLGVGGTLGAGIGVGAYGIDTMRKSGMESKPEYIDHWKKEVATQLGGKEVNPAYPEGKYPELGKQIAGLDTKNITSIDDLQTVVSTALGDKYTGEVKSIVDNHLRSAKMVVDETVQPTEPNIPIEPRERVPEEEKPKLVTAEEFLKQEPKKMVTAEEFLGKEEEPLLQEARKYKTAAEFVKEVDSNFSKYRNEINKLGNTEPGFLTELWNRANPQKVKEAVSLDIMEKIKKTGKKEYNVAVKEVQDASGEKMINGYIDIDKLTPTQYLDDTNLAEYKRLVKEDLAPIVVDYNGKTFDIYDGHHRLNAYKALGIKKVPITVNESAKSQLTDIWNKAQSKTQGSTQSSLLQEARKYKTAEEFVDAKLPITKRTVTANDNGTPRIYSKQLGGDWTEQITGAKISDKGTIAQLDIEAEKQFEPASKIVKDLFNKENAWVKDGGHLSLPEKQVLNKMKDEGLVEKVVIPNPYTRGAEDYTVWKLKSQLTDIWNKANTETQKKVIIKKKVKKVELPKPKLTIEPSRAKTEEAKKAEKEVVGRVVAKPLITKAQLKAIIANSPEFKKKPVLTVDGDKNLVFKGKMQRFSLKPDALGLQADNLKVGDEITVDTKALKAVGAEKNLRVYDQKGTYASIGKFRDGTPITLGQTENIKVIELPEMVQLAKEIMGMTPKVKEKVGRMFGGTARGVFRSADGSITLRADLFDPEVNSIDQAAKTLAHEMGHLIDWLPTKTMARGNILGRLSTLKDFRKDFWEGAGASRTNTEVKRELWELSKYWKPLPEGASESGSFIQYRKSSPEIYADFISVLFNDPALAMEKAPEAFNVFFEQMDKKPLVRDAYFELQALLSGERQTIIDARREGVKKMFKEGDIKSIDYQAAMQLKRKARRDNSMEAIKFNLVDNNTPMIRRVKDLQKSGVNINMDENPLYLLEDRNYLSGKIKVELEKNVAPIHETLKKNNISWDTFGEALFYDRIISGDRSKQANPRGITPEAADELMVDLQKGLTDVQAKVLSEQTDAFRGWLKRVAEQAYQEGLYSPEMHQQMKENPAYVTFRVIEHIEDGVDSKVYRSIGTLKDITNPADSSIFKAITTVRAMERNKTIKTSVDFLNTHYPQDIEKAKSVFSGKGMRFIEPKDRDFKLITIKREGKTEGYYVDEYIAHSLNNDTIGQNNAIMKLIAPVSYMNRRLFRPLFIGYNPGFQAFNLIRDFKRFWKNIPTMTLTRAVKRYYQAMPVAKARAFGISENPTQRELKAKEMLQGLEESKVFSTTFTDYLIGEAKDQAQIDLILKSAGLDSINENVQMTARQKILSPFVKILDTIQAVGNYIETLPKVAGVYELTGGDVSKLTAEQRSYIRKNIGSPDFFAKSYAKPITNELFLFSFAITQGIRSDLGVMINPKTRSGYWWKTAKLTLLPKILMFMAAMGLFGKWLEDQMDDASEYDKTSYTIIPFGKDDTGKSIYFRMPDDETGRFIGAIFWKLISGFDPSKDQELGKQMSDVMSLLGGQVPSVTPTISTANDIFQYLSGKNPYDSFRGRNVLSDDLFKANNWQTDKAFLGYVFNQLGGGVFMKLTSAGATPQEKGLVEEAVGLPIVSNIVGRFIRVSDYGQSEKLREVQAGVQRESARERLADKELVNKYVKQAIGNPASRTTLERELVKEKFGRVPYKKEDVAKANALKKKFRLGFVRGVSDSEIDALSYAVSNKEKAAILREIRKGMTVEEFNNLKRTVVKEKIVSSEVFRNLDD